jgi:hypothetical protein
VCDVLIEIIGETHKVKTIRTTTKNAHFFVVNTVTRERFTASAHLLELREVYEICKGRGQFTEGPATHPLAAKCCEQLVLVCI